MGVEEVSTLVQLANNLVHARNKKGLDKYQKEVLYGALSGLKYKELQENKNNALHYYSVKRIGAYVAYELWKILTKVLQAEGILLPGEKVNKTNVQECLQRLINQPCQETKLSQEIINKTMNFSRSELNLSQSSKPSARSQENLETITSNASACSINNQSALQPGFQIIHWVGRGVLIAELTQKLLKNCRVLSLVGITGIGKTTLAGRLTIEPAISQAFPLVKLVDFGGSFPNFDAVARCILGDEIAADEVLLQNPERLVAAVVGKLKTQSFFLILDMVEEILEVDSKGVAQFKESIFERFLEQVVRSDVMASRIIITSQDKLPVIAEGRHPTRTDTFRLIGLEEIEALELFNNYDIDGETALDRLIETSLLKRIIQIYEGHPLALRVIAGEIQEAPYQGDIKAYWHDYGQEIEAVESLKNASEAACKEDKPRLDRYSINLTELVKTRVEKTFTRLFKSSPLACLMLCMGAKYRRAVERLAWLMLIDDYSDEESLMAFQALQRRFLLEEEYTAHKVLYRLHSLIRRVALDNLSKIEDEVLPP